MLSLEKKKILANFFIIELGRNYKYISYDMSSWKKRRFLHATWQNKLVA